MIIQEPHFNGEKGYFVPRYPNKPHASSPLLTPTVSRCCSGSAQGSQKPPTPAQVPDSCLKHLERHSMLLFWQLNLILEKRAVLGKCGPPEGWALLPHHTALPRNLFAFVSAAAASPCPHSSSRSPRPSDEPISSLGPTPTGFPTALADSSVKLHSARWSKLTERWNSCSAVFQTAAP